jgi:hypothetical protein
MCMFDCHFIVTHDLGDVDLGGVYRDSRLRVVDGGEATSLC